MGMEITNNMSIIQFCNKNNIKTLPIRLSIKDNKKCYLDAKSGDGKWADGRGNFTIKDFEKFDFATCKGLTQLYIDETDYVGVDCTNVQQLDIDDTTGNYLDSPHAKECAKYPYFLSLTKKMPHYFIYTDHTKKSSTDIPWDHDVLYKGCWGWCHKNTRMFNGNNVIPTIKLDKIFSRLKLGYFKDDDLEDDDLQEDDLQEDDLQEDDTASQVSVEKRVYSKEIMGLIIDGLPPLAYIGDPGNYAFHMLCALKKAGATRKQVKDLMMKADYDFNNEWFKTSWTQDTSKYAYDIEFVLSKTKWREPTLGCLIDVSTLEDPKKKESCHDIIWRLFFEWTENNNLVRIKNTEIVLKMKTEYYGEEISKGCQETLNLFISSSEEISSLFNGKGLKGKRENIGCVLKENQPNDAFPFVEYNWKYFGYLNGLFNIETGVFVTEDYPKGVLCRNYFNENYNPLTELPQCLKTIYGDQQFMSGTINIHLALLGRAFYPINHLEDWGIVLVNYGVSNTGKSTTIEMINKSLNQLKTKTISSQSQDKSRFALDGKNNNELLIINEAENLPNALGAEIFKSMCRGEKVEIEGKGKDCISEDWTTPMLLASNTEIPYKDKSGGIGNRLVYFKHSSIVKPNPEIKIQLHSLIPRLVPFLCNKYLAIANKRLVLTAQIAGWNDEVSENDDEFKAWINSLNEDVYLQIKYVEGKTIKPKALQDAFDKHIKYTLNQPKTIRIGLNEQALLGLKGIEKHSVKHCKSCEKKWESGCCNKYAHTNKVNKIVYTNCELIDGGLNKDKNIYF